MGAVVSATQTQETTKARCRECQRTFTLPVIGKCPHCDSRQIGRVSPLEEPVRDLLAEVDTARAEGRLALERLDRIADAAEKLLKAVSAS
jgi:primosomal protein N'